LTRHKRYVHAYRIYELDDYLLNLPVRSLHRQHRELNQAELGKNLRRALAECDRFVVSTQPLAELFSGFHSNIVVAQNYLAPRMWGEIAPSRRLQGPKPRVGWAGGVSHTGDLSLIIDLVKALADEVDWVFMGMMPPGVEDCVAEFHRGVPIADYPRALAALNLDLALAPLELNDFNRAKSNLRLLEYGICAYPVIATDIEPYRCDLPVTLVRNRFKDWADAIRDHLRDRDALAQRGDALREAVRNRWMLEGDNLKIWLAAWSA